MLREIKSPQRLERRISLRVDGTGTASILAGSQHATLVDNGTGDYSLTLVKPAARTLVVAGLVPLATDIALSVSTLSASVVRVLARSIAAAPAAADVDFHIEIVAYDSADET